MMMWPHMVYFKLLNTKMLSLFTQHIISYLGITPFVKGERKTPLPWKADVLLMVANPYPLWSLAWYSINCPTLTFQSPLTHSHPFGPYFTMMTSTILVSLVWNNTVFKYLLQNLKRYGLTLEEANSGTVGQVNIG